MSVFVGSHGKDPSKQSVNGNNGIELLEPSANLRSCTSKLFKNQAADSNGRFSNL